MLPNIWYRAKSTLRSFLLRLKKRIAEFLFVVGIIATMTLALCAVFPLLGGIGIAILLVSSTFYGWMGLIILSVAYFSFWFWIYFRYARLNIFSA